MSDTLSPQIRFGSNAGQPATRRDGLAKVTGVATFAADNTPEGLLYAVYAPAKIARGRVRHLDVAAAEAHPGVTHVITPQNRPELEGDPSGKPTMFSFRTEVLQDDTVRYAGQPIALVLGETLEAATEGRACSHLSTRSIRRVWRLMTIPPAALSRAALACRAG